MPICEGDQEMIVDLNGLLKEFPFLNRGTVYNWTSSKTIPHSNPTGKKLTFDTTKVEAFLLSNEVITNEELKAQVVKERHSKKK
jgi:hypothetical protein